MTLVLSGELSKGLLFVFADVFVVFEGFPSFNFFLALLGGIKKNVSSLRTVACKGEKCARGFNNNWELISFQLVNSSRYE